MEIGRQSHARNWHKNYNGYLTDQFPHLIRPELLGNILLFQTQINLHSLRIFDS